MPVYYISSDELEDPLLLVRNAWARDLKDRQYFDWRGLRLEARDSQSVRRAFEAVALRVKSAIKRVPVTASTALVSTGADSTPVPLAGVRLREAFQSLSRTQQHILSYLYTLKRDDISLDELYKDFQGAREKTVSSKAELYYRIKDLAHFGFLGLSLRNQNTLLRMIQDVRPVLKDCGVRLSD